MGNYLNQEVIRMLKNGIDPQVIQQHIADENKKAYRPDFVGFMQDMIAKYKVKRTDIARQTGISQDYLYKVLNGKKKTAEKDYVVAICVAIGMNVPETQYALSINGMPYLDSRDLREHVILTCITDHRNVRKTNDWLEGAGFPLLRVSKDMEEYTPTIRLTEESEIKSSPKRHLKEVSREVFAEHCGNAPFDYTYWANIVVEDDAFNLYHVQGWFGPDFTAFTVLDDENYKLYEQLHAESNDDSQELIDIDDDEAYMDFMQRFIAGEFKDFESQAVPYKELESYEDIEDAVDSDFFRYFMEIDRLTDDKVKEVYENLCDTANYGVRIGFKISGGKVISYAEQYDSDDPASRKYFQIVETEGKPVYSISHESVYMWVEMGDLYTAVFPEREEPKYFFKTENEKDLGKLPLRDRFIMNALKAEMHSYLNKESGGFIQREPFEIEHEQMESTAEVATWAFINEQYDFSLKSNLKLLEMAEFCEGAYGSDELDTILVTIRKIATCYQNMGKEKSYRKWNDKIFEYKDRILKKAENSTDTSAAISTYAERVLNSAAEARNAGDNESVKEYCEEVIRLLEPRCNTNNDAEILFLAYIRLAFHLDEEGRSDEANSIYEKTERIVRKYHLENSPCRRSVMVFYNNYAWVLWNRFGNEEAIIYYGKAIELAEDALNEHAFAEDEMIGELKHYADGLYKLYTQTGKTKEADRLRKRVEEHNIELDV